jgi:xanthine dehydrogenase YagR molybdenum-binding subunit
MHSFGAVFVEVQVDPELGDIHVSRVVGAYDVGRVLNAKTARSQMVGGIVYGMAMALYEHTAIDECSGRYLNADLSEYLVPVNADVPEIDVILLDSDDAYENEIGVKGIGEIGTTGVAAAVANAVYHATAVRARDLPITLDKILQRPA